MRELWLANCALSDYVGPEFGITVAPNSPSSVLTQESSATVTTNPTHDPQSRNFFVDTFEHHSGCSRVCNLHLDSNWLTTSALHHKIKE